MLHLHISFHVCFWVKKMSSISGPSRGQKWIQLEISGIWVVSRPRYDENNSISWQICDSTPFCILFFWFIFLACVKKCKTLINQPPHPPTLLTNTKSFNKKHSPVNYDHPWPYHPGGPHKSVHTERFRITSTMARLFIHDS